MTTSFDGIRALKEEISGLGEVRQVILRRERELTTKHGELEVEMNAIIKMRGFADSELQRKREILRQLEEANDK